MSQFRVFISGLVLVGLLGSAVIRSTGAQSGGTQSQFEFNGQIGSFPNTPGFVGDWVVGTRTVHVTTNTGINQDDGTVAVGAIVEVNGSLRADGSVEATRIQVKQPAPPPAQCFEFKGVIHALPSTAGVIGDWTVG